MRQFYNSYRDKSNLQQLVGEIPWGHNILIFSKCKEVDKQEYYIRTTIEQGWSRNLLIHHIKTKLFERDRVELKQHNFTETLPVNLSILADDMMRSRYNLEFLDVSKEAKELAVENAIVEQIREFLLELGYGFSFIDNQYKLTLDDNEYFIDLLFFHRKLNALVAIELKVGKFRPEYAGKMNFYLNILNDKVKMSHENPAIGIILCTDKTGVEVEYALQNIHQPMGVSTYSVKDGLPEELKGILPEPQELAQKLEIKKII
jgi:predicted nuclease of restriction endonuclease-like (RecB) superfamily